MDFGPEGQDEELLPRAQERSAFRTHYLLVATRLVFVFSHGALVLLSAISLREGWEATSSSWWVTFLPVWFGNPLCCLLIIYSWFASCPYIQWCMEQRQIRLGSSLNPSILTDILPEIVMSIFALIVVILTLVGELLLCQYFVDVSRRPLSEEASIVPSAIVFFLISLLAGCHGVCFTTMGDFLVPLSCVAIATIVVILSVPGHLTGSCSWAILLPSPFGVLGILVATIRRQRAHRSASSISREEQLLNSLEQFLLSSVLIALIVLICFLASKMGTGTSSFLGAVIGGGICLIALVRARMTRIAWRLEISARDQALNQASFEDSDIPSE